MYIFKTSGTTFESVIYNQKHAFRGQPRDWFPGEIVLVNKSKKDCGSNEKQISYIMRLVTIRTTSNEEIEKYWPGNPGRWRYIVECMGTERLSNPFNLEDVLGEAAAPYKPAVNFRKLEPEHEDLINSFLLLGATGFPSTNNPDEIPPAQQFHEGASQRIIVNAYERNQAARMLCIEHYGHLCQICGFDFEQVYGELGAKYIHVHHIVPLADIGKEYAVNPVEDLIPVCANCHCMIHRRKPALTLNEIRKAFIGLQA